MLPRDLRLNKKEDFRKVYKRSRNITSPYFRLLVANYPGEEKKSFGIVVSKMIAKKATERNLYKRQVRHIIKDNLAAISPGKYIIILRRPPGDKYDEFRRELEQCLKKISLV